ALPGGSVAAGGPGLRPRPRPARPDVPPDARPEPADAGSAASADAPGATPPVQRRTGRSTRPPTPPRAGTRGPRGWTPRPTTAAGSGCAAMPPHGSAPPADPTERGSAGPWSAPTT